MKRFDLHTHSNCSDGLDEPFALLDLAKAAGLSGLSITDHDTIQAYTPQLFERAGELGLELLMGTEVSSEMERTTVHILAYAFNPSLKDFLDEVVRRRVIRNRKIIEHLRKKGIEIPENELSAFPAQIVGRPHIARILIRKGIVSTMQEAFDRFLKDEAIRYSSGGKFSPSEVIEAIHQASGKAVLAHPHFLKPQKVLRELLALPFDGLECYYGRCFPEQERPWVEMAQRRHLIATGGSDYHGAIRPDQGIGCSWVNEETFLKLKE